MTKTVAILGAGPVGLAAAAHVLERGMLPLVLEQGDAVGHAVRVWGHVPMFSNWRYNIDAAAARRLEGEGWKRPDPEAHPTGDDLLTDYLEPLGQPLAPWLEFGRRVVAVSREGIDKVKDACREKTPFVIETEGVAGREWHRADAVIDATGTWFQPNPGGAGRPVPGETGNARIHPLASARLAASAHPLAAVCLVVFGGPAAYGFAILHGAGNGILTIAKGTLPLALFGAAGYGARLGWLNAPARLLQAAAPLIFGAALAAWGLQAIWLTAGVGVLATAALFLLRRT